MTGQASARAVRLTVGFVALFFVAVLPLLPKDSSDVKELSVRWAVSITLFSVGIVGVFRLPQTSLPLVIGVLPILFVLRSNGAIHGMGVDLFYLIVALLAWYKLPENRTGRELIVGGTIWLLLFLGECLVHLAIQTALSGEFNPGLAMQMATFYVLLYRIPQRLTRETFRLSTCALATGCAAVLIWIAGDAILAGALDTRWGERVGVNPNLTALFAVYSLYAAFFFMMLQRRTQINLLFVAGALLSVIVVVFTQSRAAAIQLALMPVFLFPRVRFIRALMIAAVTLVFSVWLVRGQDVSRISAEMLQSEQGERFARGSVEERVQLNSFAWRLALKNPLFGAGQSTFGRNAQTEALTEGSGEGSYHHNVIAGTAAEFGFVGLGFFVLWYLAFLRSHARGHRYSAYVMVFCLLGMVQWLTHGFIMSAFDAIPFVFALRMERLEELIALRSKFRWHRSSAGHAHGPSISHLG